MKMESRVTIFQLQELVERAIQECVEADYIHGEVNAIESAKHISKTVIGELVELEVLRKIQAISRTQKEVSKDLEFLDSVVIEEHKKINLRISGN